MREQYEYQLAVAEELARAVKMRGKLTTFGVVLHDVDGEVFWLNHNNYQFADELVRLLDKAQSRWRTLVPRQTTTFTLTCLLGRNSAESPWNHSGRTG